MKCPRCGSTEVNKNGHCRGKQNYRCKNCRRQFLEYPSVKGYSEDAKQICLKMVRDGLGFRAIERATGVSHNTIINWVKHATAEQSNLDETDETPDSAILTTVCKFLNCPNNRSQLTAKDS